MANTKKVNNDSKKKPKETVQEKVISEEKDKPASLKEEFVKKDRLGLFFI